MKIMAKSLKTDLEIKKNMKERILITGGAGFIGTHLVDYLFNQGNQITVLDNLSTGNLKNLRDGVTFIKGDVRDEKTVVRALEGCTKVYHHAAELGVDRIMKMSDSAMADVDYHGTKTVLEACRNSEVKTLLFASTSEVYGDYLKEDLPMVESDDFKPDTPYGEAKKSAEVLCSEFSKETGMNTVCVRYFNVYGARQTLNGYAIPNFIRAALRNETIKIHGDGTQIRDFTYIDDAVEMTIGVCQGKFNGEVFNIGSGDYVNMIDLASIIKRLCKSKSEIKFIAPRRPTDTHNKYSDPSKVIRMTGVNSKMDFEKGLIETIDYYKTLYVTK
jgi:UDP-glucose 4-epimerase